MPLRYYGFSDKPFEISPDLKFLYLTPGYRIALEAIVRGITDREGLIVLTGEVGTGKTMLIYSVLEKLPPKVKTVFIFHSTFNFIELLQQIFFDLEESVPAGGIVQIKDQLLLYLNKLKDRGEKLAVLLDEAQKLSEEVLRGLFSLLERESWISEILQIVLVGQPELEETFTSAYLKYRPKNNPLRIKINPLSKEESLDYIEHRLKMAGRSSTDIFSPQALSLIVEKAGGIPRVINIVCDNALFAGSKASVKRIEAHLMVEIIRNLEGPEPKPKNKKKPSLLRSYPKLSSRLIIRDGLLVFFGSLLVIGFFLFRPELTAQLNKSKWFWELELWSRKMGDLDSNTQPQKRNHENSLRLDLKLEGRSNSERKKFLEGQAQSPAFPVLSIRKVQVKDGDSLSKIIIYYYGRLNESLIDLLLTHNASISDMDLLLIDQPILLPELKEESLILPSADRTFSLHLGTFPDEKEAGRLINHSSLKGKNIVIKPKKVSSRKTWYRVEVESVKSKEEALETLRALRQRKMLPFFEPGSILKKPSRPPFRGKNQFSTRIAPLPFQPASATDSYGTLREHRLSQFFSLTLISSPSYSQLFFSTESSASPKKLPSPRFSRL